MKRLVPAIAAIATFLLQASAYADVAAEPPLQSNTSGLVVFGVLFLGFCVGILWMIWRAGKKNSDKAEPKA